MNANELIDELHKSYKSQPAYKVDYYDGKGRRLEVFRKGEPYYPLVLTYNGENEVLVGFNDNIGHRQYELKPRLDVEEWSRKGIGALERELISRHNDALRNQGVDLHRRASVKDQLVRLGSTNPSLRGHIRPVLAELNKTAASGVPSPQEFWKKYISNCLTTALESTGIEFNLDMYSWAYVKDPEGPRLGREVIVERDNSTLRVTVGGTRTNTVWQEDVSKYDSRTAGKSMGKALAKNFKQRGLI